MIRDITITVDGHEFMVSVGDDETGYLALATVDGELRRNWQVVKRGATVVKAWQPRERECLGQLELEALARLQDLRIANQRELLRAMVGTNRVKLVKGLDRLVAAGLAGQVRTGRERKYWLTAAGETEANTRWNSSASPGADE